MSDIRDEYGNPIQLTDELGRPVQLTDEHGVPIHLSGVATTVDSSPHAAKTTVTSTDPMIHGGTHFAPTPADAVVGAGIATTLDSAPHAGTTTTEPMMHGGTHFSPTPADAAVGTGVQKTVPSGGAPLISHPEIGGEKQQLGRAGSSSSSSSEDDGKGGRRKKKGLMQKIKEKLPGHKNKEEEAPATVYTATTKISVISPAAAPDEPKTEYIRVEHHEEEHEKKGLMDKIKDKVLPGHR